MAMPLDGYTIKWVGSPNFTPGRALPIDHVTPHHCAGFSWPDGTFNDPNRQASSHYSVWGREIHQHVAEENTAWTDGNYYSNASGITTEMVNAAGEPDWKIAEDTFDTSARLQADILLRHGLGRAQYTGNVDADNVYRHRRLGELGYCSATRCPGEWFIANTPRFIDLVNAYIEQATRAESPNAVRVQLYQGNATPAQLWKMERYHDGTVAFRSRAREDLMLDVRGGTANAKVGTQVWAYKDNGTKAQRWTRSLTGNEGLFELIPFEHHDLRLDIDSNSTADRTNIRLWNSNHTMAQRFSLVPHEGDWYWIVAQNSGKCLDLDGGGTVPAV
jgi:hypothetical protein